MSFLKILFTKILSFCNNNMVITISKKNVISFCSFYTRILCRTNVSVQF